MRSLRVVFVAAFLAWCPSAFAQGLSQYLTLQEWRGLVQHTVGSIYELQDLWDFNEAGHEVRASGGIVRNTQRWLAEQLKTKTPDEIKRMPKPSLADLHVDAAYPGGTTDLDLVGSPSELKALELAVPKYARPWADPMSLSEHNRMIARGGSSVSIARVSATQIDDPTDSLASYWRGELVYRAPSIRTTPEDALLGLLRFWRFEASMPELSVTEASRGRIAAAIALAKRARNHPGYSRALSKALGNLTVVAGYEETVRRLLDLGLVEPLVRAGAQLIPPDDATPLVPRGLGLRERLSVERLGRHEPTTCAGRLARRVYDRFLRFTSRWW